MERIGLRTFLVVAVILLFVGAFFVRAPLPTLLVAPEPVANVGGFVISNTLIATWLTVIVLLLVFRAATSNMQLVPRGIQNLMEFAVEALYNFTTSVAGVRYGRVFFPLIGTIFFFVLFNGWLSLVPGFGTIGKFVPEHHGIEFQRSGGVALVMPGARMVPEGAPAADDHAAPAVDSHGAPVDSHGAPAADTHAATGGKEVGELIPFFRGANTDIKTTLALALVAMFFVEMWGIRYQGLGGYGSKFLNFTGFKQGPFMGVIYFIIGLIETVSELARVISFTFRLFGNMFAGEVLLAVITFLVPWVLADIFYGLELFVGLVQALVFAGLTLVFASSAVAGHGDSHGEEAHAEQAGAGAHAAATH